MQHLEVELFLLPTEHGGRKTAIHSGYRGQFYDLEDCDAIWGFDAPVVEPGQSVKGFVQFLRPELHLARMKAGLPILMREGSKVIGFGTILRVLSQ